MVCATVGSSTVIFWKRRSRAASFSRCLRYSSSVVAPMVWSSPRATIGVWGLGAAGGVDGVGGAGGVDAPFGRTRPHERVQLVDEQDDVAAGADLFEHLL